MNSGFIVKPVHIAMLKAYPTGERNAILGAAFAKWLGLKEKDMKDWRDKALVESIFEEAKAFAENRSLPKSSTERSKKHREKRRMSNCVSTENCNAKQRGATQCNAMQRGATQCNESNACNAEGKERKKEYIPPTPKGGDESEEDPLEGVEFPDGEDEDGTDIEADEGGAKEREEEDDAADEIERMAERMLERHPKMEFCDVVTRAIRRVCKKKPPPDLAELERNHAEWCESEAWTRECGRYAPMLSKWIRSGKWKDAPPEKKTRAAEEAGNRFGSPTESC